MLGEQLKKAFQEARIASQEAADRMGMSKANLYILFKKDTFEVEYLRKASEITGKPMAYFFEGESTILDSKASDGGAFGEKVITQMAAGIEELKKFFEEEIRVKNQQIAGLQRTVDALVGKSESATVDPLFGHEVEMIDFEAMLSQYKLSALQGMGSLVTPKPAIIQKPALVKVVALS